MSLATVEAGSRAVPAVRRARIVAVANQKGGVGKTEQPVQRRQGAGDYDINRMRRHRLYTAAPNRHGDFGDARRFA